MALIDFYPQIRHIHISLVLVSGGLFLARGVGVLRGASWPMAAGVRRASYSIDTALLGAALMLVHILQLNPLVVGWLGTKLVLLLVYIGLGSMALKRAKTPRGRLGFLIASMLCYGYMLTVARTHSPWGVLAFWA